MLLFQSSMISLSVYVLVSWESGWLSGYLSGLPPLRAGIQFWPRPACGLSFSRSQPDSRVFLRVLRFSSLIKNRLTANWHLAVVLCSDIKHGLYSGSQRRLCMLSARCREPRPSQFSLRMQVRVISTSNIFIFYFKISKRPCEGLWRNATPVIVTLYCFFLDFTIVSRYVIVIVVAMSVEESKISLRHLAHFVPPPHNVIVICVSKIRGLLLL